MYKYIEEDDNDSDNSIENLTVQTIELFATLCHNPLFKEFIRSGFKDVSISILKCMF